MVYLITPIIEKQNEVQKTFLAYGKNAHIICDKCKKSNDATNNKDRHDMGILFEFHQETRL